MAYRIRAKVGDRIHDRFSGVTGTVEKITLPHPESRVQMPVYEIRPDRGTKTILSTTIIDPDPDFEILSDEDPRPRKPTVSREDAELLAELERAGFHAEAQELRKALGLS